jgi:hypothetical protein
MSQTQPSNLAELAASYLDVLVQAEQAKDPTSLVLFVSPGVYDVRPAIDASFQRIVVTCAYAEVPVPVVTAAPQDGGILSAKSGSKKSK